MKFANVDEKKSEASKGAKGFCRLCGSELIARCGEVYAHHWAHKSKRNCDHWWENETEWHRLWKENFPIEWQEVIQFADNGEKHIADVKTESDWVLEFQRSYLKPEERRSRNAFYKKLVWIVDGTRRKTDIPQFEKTLNESAVLANNPPLQIRRVLFPEECRLLREWHDSDALVFFDFQGAEESKQTMLWLLFPKITNTEAYISTFPRGLFVELHNENKFDEVVRDTILPIRKELERAIQIRQKNEEYSRPNRLPAFERNLTNIRRRRKRF